MGEMCRKTDFAVGRLVAPGAFSWALQPARWAWFRHYAPNERREKFDHIVQSWDTANKATELSDFSVCTT